MTTQQGGPETRTSTYTGAGSGAPPGRPALPERWGVIRLLGAGGQAEVWLARDRRLDELVAIKVFKPAMSPTAIERLRREVHLGRALQHPNLVSVFELIESAGRLALSMEWMPGGNLRAVLNLGGPLAIAEVESIAEQALSALAQLHSHGVIHRDVKLSNLLRNAETQIKLADLGLVKVLAGDDSASSHRPVVGSPGYMSPEQLRGEELTPASDLYSLGVTLFELLTGSSPFGDGAASDASSGRPERALRDARALRPDCPRWLARFVAQLLESHPADRFAGGDAALTAFRRLRWAASPRALRRRVLAAAGMVAVAAAVGVGVRAVLDARQRPATVMAAGSVVRALGPEGRTLWEYACGATVVQIERADLDGDAEVETAVAVVPVSRVGERTAQSRPSEVLVLNWRGRLVSLFRPGEVAQRYDPQPIAPWFLIPRLFLTDLDGDGHPDLVVNCRHRSLGVAALFGYWGRVRRWEFLLSHPGGWLFHLAAVPGAEPPRLRFLAFNSLIGSHAVVGELIVGAPREVPSSSLNYLAAALGGATLSWYTPLGPQAAALPADDQPGFRVAADGSSTFAVRGVPFTVDRFGNPIPGPNAGRDLRHARIEFLQSLAQFARSYSNVVAPALVRAERDRLRSEFAPLMKEAPYRSVLDLDISRELARAGDIHGAAKILREDWAELPYDGLGYWLAHAQALSGDPRAAVATVEATMANARNSVGGFRSSQLLFRLAIELRDMNLYRRILPVFMDGQPPELRAAVEARAHLWWDRPSAGDCRARSFDIVPDGAAMACLARWRLGRTRPDDPQAMEVALRTNPDAAPEYLTARAMSLLAQGRATDALTDLDRALAALSRAGRDRWDFLWAVNDQLARACRAKVLLAAGRRNEAFRLARELRPKLRRGLLPAILVEEVLASGKVGTRSQLDAPRPPSRAASGR